MFYSLKYILFKIESVYNDILMFSKTMLFILQYMKLKEMTSVMNYENFKMCD